MAGVRRMKDRDRTISPAFSSYFFAVALTNSSDRQNYFVGF